MELKKIVSWNYPNKNVIYWDYIKSFPEILVTSALLHDVGKNCTTFTDEEGKIHSYKHEIESEKIARRLLWEEDINKRERICSLVRLHMDVHKLKNYWKFETFKKHIVDLMNKTDDFHLLCLLSLCDTKGAQYNSEEREADIRKCEELCDFARHPGKRLDWRIKELHRVYFPTKQTVVVLIGLPGSGKSTWASGQNATVISRDTIREELCMCKPGEKIVGTPEQEAIVSELFDQRFVAALKAEENIIVDNINLKKSYRDHYKELAKHYNVYWIYVYIQTENLAINEMRRPEISHETFLNMIDKFDFPLTSEYDFNTIICI